MFNYCRDTPRWWILQLRKYQESHRRRKWIQCMDRMQQRWIWEQSTLSGLHVRWLLGLWVHPMPYFSPWQMWLSNSVPFLLIFLWFMIFFYLYVIRSMYAYFCILYIRNHLIVFNQFKLLLSIYDNNIVIVW